MISIGNDDLHQQSFIQSSTKSLFVCNNYRSYVKSKDIYQLSGKFKTVEMEKKCNGAESNADLVKNWLTPYTIAFL